MRSQRRCSRVLGMSVDVCECMIRGLCTGHKVVFDGDRLPILCSVPLLERHRPPCSTLIFRENGGQWPTASADNMARHVSCIATGRMNLETHCEPEEMPHFSPGRLRSGGALLGMNTW